MLNDLSEIWPMLSYLSQWITQSSEIIPGKKIRQTQLEFLMHYNDSIKQNRLNVKERKEKKKERKKEDLKKEIKEWKKGSKVWEKEKNRRKYIKKKERRKS